MNTPPVYKPFRIFAPQIRHLINIPERQRYLYVNGELLMQRSTSSCFWESWKCHCSLSLLLLYQINIMLTICCCWLLHNLEKRKKSNEFNKLQVEVLFLIPSISSPYSPYISPPTPHTPNIGPPNLSFFHIYAQGVLTELYGIALIYVPITLLNNQCTFRNCKNFLGFYKHIVLWAKTIE